MRRLWPDSLYGRLVIILVSGMLAAQVMTSSIWYDVRHGQVLEIPTRLLAARLADLVLLDQHDPRQAEQLLSAMQATGLYLLPSGPTTTEPLSTADRRQERLLRKIIEARTGKRPELRLLRVDIIGADGKPADLPVLFGTTTTRSYFLVEMRLPSGRELYIETTEEQGWTSTAPLSLLFDYVMRIYLLRIVVVVLIALLAVRLALRPLKQMASAAEALGHDIHRPPVPLDGPKEVRQAAQALNVMQRRLIDGIGERTRLFAAVSHDLRTPITRLRLRTELLGEETLRQRFRDDLQHMEEMVSASLDFLRSGELEDAREPVNIDALLQGLQADFSDLGSPVALHGRALPLLAHASGLRRALQNLLENAARHASGPIDLFVDDASERLTLSVADRGPGIPAEQLEQAIEPFFRLDSARSQGGYGLGLSIAHSIARAHGGELRLSARTGGGLLAVLELPRSQ